MVHTPTRAAINGGEPQSDMLHLPGTKQHTGGLYLLDEENDERQTHSQLHQATHGEAPSDARRSRVTGLIN